MISRKSGKWLSGLSHLFVTGAVVFALGTGAFSLSTLVAGGDDYGSKSKAKESAKAETASETVEIEVKSGQIDVKEDEVEAGLVKLEIKNDDTKAHTLNIERTDKSSDQWGQGRRQGEQQRQGGLEGDRQSDLPSDAPSDESAQRDQQGEQKKSGEAYGQSGMKDHTGANESAMKNIQVQPGETKKLEVTLYPGEYRIFFPETSRQSGQSGMETTLTVVEDKEAGNKSGSFPRN